MSHLMTVRMWNVTSYDSDNVECHMTYDSENVECHMTYDSENVECHIL